MKIARTSVRIGFGRAFGVWFCVFWLLATAAVTGVIAFGGRPDPRIGQALDGAWRFHAGDNASWAAPGTDDSGWDRLTLVAKADSRDGDVGIPGYIDGWRARGHPRLEGYGWYRRQVTLPPGEALALVGPPAVDDGYEMFWDGHPIGGVGRLSATPRVNVTRPFRVVLPPTGKTTAVLAIRAYMQPGPRDAQSGGLRTVPVLASRGDADALYRAEWWRTVAGYIADAALPVGMAVLAAIAAFAGSRTPFLLWLVPALIATGALRLGNAVSAWSDLLTGSGLQWQNSVVLGPLAKLCWVMAWNAWTKGREQRVVGWAAVAAYLILVTGALLANPMIEAAGRIIVALSLAAIAVRIVRRGEHKVLALAAMALAAVGSFAADLNAFGVPGIWFPFNIGVSRSQYAWGLLLPLLGFLIAVTGRKRGDAFN